jgi:multidrug resistance efflux pump
MNAMTKEEADKAWRDFPGRGDWSAWAEPVAREFWRARSEEARLLEENRIVREGLEAAERELKRQRDTAKATLTEKEATIKALADALEQAKRRLAQPENTTIRDRMEIDAALRLAGRLK